MSDLPKNSPSWAFQPKDDGWVLTIPNVVGSVELTEDGEYIARMDDQWFMSCPDLDCAIYFIKQRLASQLRKKAEEFNALADDLLDPGENPF